MSEVDGLREPGGVHAACWGAHAVCSDRSRYKSSWVGRGLASEARLCVYTAAAAAAAGMRWPRLGTCTLVRVPLLLGLLFLLVSCCCFS